MRKLSKLYHTVFWGLLCTSLSLTAQAQEGAGGSADSGSTGGWRFSVGASQSLASRAKFDSVTVVVNNPSVTVTGNGTLEMANALSLEFDARNMPQNGWGFIGGLTYDLPRKGGKFQMTLGNSAVLSDAGQDELKMTVLHGSVVYRWNSFYLPFGINFGSVSWTSSSSTTGPDVSGGLGAQVGVGYFARENIAVELTSRATALKMRQTDSSGSIDFGGAYLSTLLLSAKYLL